MVTAPTDAMVKVLTKQADERREAAEARQPRFPYVIGPELGR